MKRLSTRAIKDLQWDINEEMRLEILKKREMIKGIEKGVNIQMSTMTLEQFKAKVDGTKVTCKICQRKFHTLSGHLLDEHKLTVGQYKNRFNLTQADVISPLVLEMMKQRPRKRITENEALDKVWAEMGDWTESDLQELGKGMPHKNPELIPEMDLNYRFPKEGMETVSLAVVEGMNLFISGPTECGKTALVEQVHARMGRPLLRCNMNGEITVKNFIGQNELNANGTFFKEGILPRAEKVGATLLVDEIDFMPPHIGSSLHSVLEKGRTIYIPELGTHLKAEKGFTVIATANTGGKGDKTGLYTGTEVLNTAFLNRFQLRLEMDYLKPDVEVEILSAKFPAQKLEVIQKLVSFAGDVRAAFKQGSLEIPLGHRKLDDFLRILPRRGMDKAYRLVLEDWLAMEEKQTLSEIRKRHGI